MSDKQRADFEKWYKSTDFWKMENSMAKKIALDSWQSAIASVVVKLPELEKHDRDAVTEKLEEAGIRYE